MFDFETHSLQSVEDDHIWVGFDCARCGMVFWLSPGVCLLSELAVIAFFEAHGHDLHEHSYLELPFVNPENPTLESSTPIRVRVTVELEGDQLMVWMNGDGEIIETERK